MYYLYTLFFVIVSYQIPFIGVTTDKCYFSGAVQASYFFSHDQYNSLDSFILKTPVTREEWEKRCNDEKNSFAGEFIEYGKSGFLHLPGMRRATLIPVKP
jgi:hypothetical protein